MINMMMMMIMAFQHVNTVTKTHHDGNLSVMNKVGICPWQNPTIDDNDGEVGLGATGGVT